MSYIQAKMLLKNWSALLQFYQGVLNLKNTGTKDHLKDSINGSDFTHEIAKSASKTLLLLHQKLEKLVVLNLEIGPKCPFPEKLLFLLLLE